MLDKPVEQPSNEQGPPAPEPVDDDSFGDEVRERWQRLRTLHERLHRNPVTGLITKVVVTVLGLLIIAVGIVLSGPGIPGPGFLVILAGIAVLSTEYAWAEKVLHKARDWWDRVSEKAKNMDPAVRRRRLILGFSVAVIVTGAVIGYLVVYDWPTWSISAWDWVQNFSGAVPDLPGM